MRAVTRLLGVVVLFACVAMVAAAQETVVLKYGTFGDIARPTSVESRSPHLKPRIPTSKSSFTMDPTTIG